MNRLYWISIGAITSCAFAAAGLQATFENQRLKSEAITRGASLLEGVSETVRLNLEQGRIGRIERLVKPLQEKQHVLGLALCVPSGGKSIQALAFPKTPVWGSICESLIGPQNTQDLMSWAQKESTHGHLLQIHAAGIDLRDVNASSGITLPPTAGRNTARRGSLVLAQDLSYLQGLWLEGFFRSLLVAWCAGAAIFLLIASQIRLQARTWIQGYAKYLYHNLRALASGKKPSAQMQKYFSHQSDLIPISKTIENLTSKILTLPVRERDRDREPAVAPPPVSPEVKLINSLKNVIGNRDVVIFANREPYIHQRKDDKIELIRPASGLVTALEPILRNAGGMWIGHGSGSADRQTVNEKNEIAVPPGNPSYTLKRVWLTPEEEEGYYYGFSNEGLWPLCHLAHNRPIFRLPDWEKYCLVNNKFCLQTPEHLLSEQSLILVQDYHFAMLPRMLKKRAMSLQKNGKKGPKISLFWHIPWPNPEAFGICPWGQELLRGMLGSDVIGFHTQYHCNNFLETCDRYLEARVDWENFSVTMENHQTFVRPFPIGIDTSPVRALTESERAELKARYRIKSEIVAVGVDRVDYTKGLVERVEAVERFLEKYPEYIGRFTLVQMGSPSRTHIPAYRFLAEQLEKAVTRVNTRFGETDRPDGYKPVQFLGSHHEWEEIKYFYQLGDLCLVTSLHDGMNLVAKEYVWCQPPGRGALVLSKFAGAARELNDAFVVNPYSIEEIADAIAGAIALSPAERERRMRNMKARIEGHSAFHWASDLIRALVGDDQTVPQGPSVFSAPQSGLTSGYSSNSASSAKRLTGLTTSIGEPKTSWMSPPASS